MIMPYQFFFFLIDLRGSFFSSSLYELNIDQRGFFEKSTFPFQGSM